MSPLMQARARMWAQAPAMANPTDPARTINPAAGLGPGARRRPPAGPAAGRPPGRTLWEAAEDYDG